MSKRRAEKLTKVLPFAIYHLDFHPSTVAVINTSKFAVYINIGSVSKPDVKNFTDIIAPFSYYVTDPGEALDFAVSVDNSLEPNSDFTMPVSVIFSTGNASSQSPIAFGVLSSILGEPYITKLLSVQASSLIDVLPLDDLSGTGAKNIISTARPGTYNNNPVLQNELFVDGAMLVPHFNSAGSQSVSMNATQVNSAINKNEGTIVIWGKATSQDWLSAAVWDFLRIDTTFSETLRIEKTAGGGLQLWLGSANVGVGLGTVIGWHMFGISWSAANNRIQFVVDNLPPTVSGPFSGFAGTFNSVYLGANNGMSNFLSGTIAAYALWGKELTAAEFLRLYS